MPLRTQEQYLKKSLHLRLQTPLPSPSLQKKKEFWNFLNPLSSCEELPPRIKKLKIILGLLLLILSKDI